MRHPIYQGTGDACCILSHVSVLEQNSQVLAVGADALVDLPFVLDVLIPACTTIIAHEQLNPSSTIALSGTYMPG
jgi:hypothetical protein